MSDFEAAELNNPRQEFTLQNVLAWCKDVSRVAEDIVKNEKDSEAIDYWSGQRDALRDLAWWIQWKLDGEPDFPQVTEAEDTKGE